jgi:hypothetical protein
MKRGYSLAYGACVLLAVGVSSAKAQDRYAACTTNPRQFAEDFYTAKFKAKTILELHELGNGLNQTCPDMMQPGYPLARYIQKTLQDENIELAQQMYRFTLDETIQKHGFPKDGPKVCSASRVPLKPQEHPLADYLALLTFGPEVTRVTYKPIGWFSDTAVVRIDRARTRETDLEEILFTEGKHSDGTFYTKAAEGSVETCLVAIQLGFASGKKQDLRFPHEGLSYVLAQIESFGLRQTARLAAFKKPLADYIPGWPKDRSWDAKLKELQTLRLLP